MEGHEFEASEEKFLNDRRFLHENSLAWGEKKFPADGWRHLLNVSPGSFHYFRKKTYLSPQLGSILFTLYFSDATLAYNVFSFPHSRSILKGHDNE